MSYEGKLISITAKGSKAKVVYTDNIQPEGMSGMVTKTKTEETDHAISDRFSNVMRAFLGHGLVRLGLLCSNLDEKAMKSRRCVDMPEFKNFNVQGIKFTGDDEDERVHISLTWETPEGEIVPIKAPPISVRDGGYPYEKFLENDIENVIQEANAYIEGQNYKGQQLEMFAGGDEEQF